MAVVLVAAPHPDDETLGCGGTLLRHAAEGDDLHWLILTRLDEGVGHSADRIARRESEIDQVAAAFGFKSVHRGTFVTTRLDLVPRGDVIARVSGVCQEVRPTTVYVPYPGDAHSEHRAVFEAGVACTKWFRYPSVRRVLAYETPSETEMGLDPDANGFRPTVFVDITKTIDEKVRILSHFEGEVGEFPFPRSEGALRALAAYRGMAAGCVAAEAFMLLREIL